MPGQTSELESVLRRRAERLGIPFEQLLKHDRQMLHGNAVVHADCPTPDLVKNMLDDNEMVRYVVLHVLNCPMCAAMVRVAYKSSEK